MIAFFLTRMCAQLAQVWLHKTCKGKEKPMFGIFAKSFMTATRTDNRVRHPNELPKINWTKADVPSHLVDDVKLSTDQ